MIQAPDPSTPYARLIPELRAEISFRLERIALYGFGGVLSLALIFGLLTASATNVRDPRAWFIAPIMAGGLMLWAIPAYIAIILIVRAMGGWAGILSTQRLCTFYELKKEDLSNRSARSQMDKAEFWLNGMAGLAVTVGLITCFQIPLLLFRERFIGPPGAVLSAGLGGYGVMIRAWQVKRLVHDRALGSETP